MKKSQTSLHIIITAIVLLTLTVFIVFSACSRIDDDVFETETTAISVSEKPETRPTETSKIHVTNTPPATETTETTRSIVMTENPNSDIEHVKDVYVYSVWYDAVESNPADYDSIESRKASALKGVFYFSEPLTIDLQARLYKDDTLFMTRVIKMKDNVTAEADFSASFEDFDSFKSGEYYIELLLDGEPIATTSVMRVK